MLSLNESINRVVVGSLSSMVWGETPPCHDASHRSSADDYVQYRYLDCKQKDQNMKRLELVSNARGSELFMTPVNEKPTHETAIKLINPTKIALLTTRRNRIIKKQPLPLCLINFIKCILNISRSKRWFGSLKTNSLIWQPLTTVSFRDHLLYGEAHSNESIPTVRRLFCTSFQMKLNCQSEQKFGQKTAWSFVPNTPIQCSDNRDESHYCCKMHSINANVWGWLISFWWRTDDMWLRDFFNILRNSASNFKHTVGKPRKQAFAQYWCCIFNVAPLGCDFF